MLSFIVPTRMRREKILLSLSSILNQSYTDWECVIVDDNDSADFLLSIPGFEELLSKGKFHIESARHATVGFPVHNIGIGASSGDIIFRLDDDVILSPRFAELALPGFNDPNVVAVGGCFRTNKKPFSSLRGKKGNFLYIDKTDLGLGLRYTLDVQLRSHDIHRWFEVDHIHSSYLYRRTAIDEIGGFEERIRNGEETLPFVHWALRGYKFLINTECSAEHVTDEGGWRASKREFPNDPEMLQRLLYKIYIAYRGYFPSHLSGERLSVLSRTALST